MTSNHRHHREATKKANLYRERWPDKRVYHSKIIWRRVKTRARVHRLLHTRIMDTKQPQLMKNHRDRMHKANRRGTSRIRGPTKREKGGEKARMTLQQTRRTHSICRPIRLNRTINQLQHRPNKREVLFKKKKKTNTHPTHDKQTNTTKYNTNQHKTQKNKKKQKEIDHPPTKEKPSTPTSTTPTEHPQKKKKPGEGGRAQCKSNKNSKKRKENKGKKKREIQVHIFANKEIRRCLLPIPDTTLKICKNFRVKKSTVKKYGKIVKFQQETAEITCNQNIFRQKRNSRQEGNRKKIFVKKYWNGKKNRYKNMEK